MPLNLHHIPQKPTWQWHKSQGRKSWTLPYFYITQIQFSTSSLFFVCAPFKMYSGHPKIHAVAIVSKIQFMPIVLDVMPINVWIIIELDAIFLCVTE